MSSSIISLYRNNAINVAVDLLLNDYHFFSTIEQHKNQDNFYVYDSSTGKYLLDAEVFIFDKLNEIFPNQFKHYSHIRDIINDIQKYSPIIPNDQVDPSHIINYNNGIYDKNQNKLLPHSPNFYTTKQIPTNYIQQEQQSSLVKHAKSLELLNYID